MFLNKILGIITQGDYAIGNYSVRNHLKTLVEKDCDITVCACTIGRHKQKIQNAIDSYPKHHYIDKKMCEDGNIEKDDLEKAMEIITHLYHFFFCRLYFFCEFIFKFPDIVKIDFYSLNGIFCSFDISLMHYNFTDKLTTDRKSVV